MHRSAVLIAAATLVASSQAITIKQSINPKTSQHSKRSQYMQPSTTSNQSAKDVMLAKIGNDPIYQSDFDLFLANVFTNEQRQRIQSIRGGIEQYLNQFLDLKVLAAKAKKEGFDKKPDYINKASIMQMQLLTQALMERDITAIEAKITVTDNEAKTYFDAHKEKFNTPETFSACHILIGNKTTDNKVLTNEEIQAKIARVQEELKNGKDFADVAKDFSDDPGSKNSGGLYENIEFGKFVKEFEQAVRTQPIGKVGDPVKTQFGYHLIKVVKITPAIIKTFEESKDAAIEQATAEKFQLAIAKYIDEIKKEVNYKKLDHNTVNKTNHQS